MRIYLDDLFRVVPLSLLIPLIAIVGAPNAVYGGSINIKNWKSDPQIKKVRMLYFDTTKEVKDNNFKLFTKKYTNGSNSQDKGSRCNISEFNLALNRTAHVRYAHFEETQNRITVNSIYIFDNNSKLRYLLVSFDGDDYLKESFFDENGQRLYSVATEDKVEFELSNPQKHLYLRTRSEKGLLSLFRQGISGCEEKQ